MTRRRIIAGVILLAAVAVAVPAARRVAYREVHVDGMVYLLQRWQWLPGNAVYVPDQVCFACVAERHDTCLRIDNWRVPVLILRNGRIAVVTVTHYTGYLERIKQRHNLGPDVTLLDYPTEFRCTCTEPSHDGGADSSGPEEAIERLSEE